MTLRVLTFIAVLALLSSPASLAAQTPSVDTSAAQEIDLPTSKALIGDIPGNPQRLNSLPISMAVSPDSRYVVTVNAGYGTFESNYDQSLAVFDTQTGALTDFPDARTGLLSPQTLYSGLAFSHDGQHIYASMGSITNPGGDGKKAIGDGIAVYSFSAGKIAPERLIPLPLQQLPPGRQSNVRRGLSDKGVSYPAAILVLGSGAAEKLLVADNLADNVVLVDAATGAIERSFDVSESDVVPSTYPVALALAPDGKRAFVALWNASEIVELELATGKVGRKLTLLKPDSAIAPGSHPSAFALAPDGKTLYVALSNRDAVASVNVSMGQFALKGYFDTRLPGQTYFGAEPVALAVNGDGSRLYVANAGSDAVAVLDTGNLTAKTSRLGMVVPSGFVPTDWLPMSLSFIPSPTGGKLYVATEKGRGSGPNNFPQRPLDTPGSQPQRANAFISTLTYGSLATLDEPEIQKHLASWSSVVLESNRMKAAQEKIVFPGGARNPIKHVIYIIKENRTYDQVLGDLKQSGVPVGNGDPSLAMYGESITPNQHKLALQFGVLDNFYDSGEQSSIGHVWSTAGIVSDYMEKTWQIYERSSQRTYDYKGMVAFGYPLLQQIPDVDDPASGYLWGNLATHGKTYLDFSEFISSAYCNQGAVPVARLREMQNNPECARKVYAPGDALPEKWGGGINKWPWAIPVLAGNVATKQELVDHFVPEAPEFNTSIPDQIRVNIFLKHLDGWIADKKQGNDTMPSFILLYVPNDHTSGTTAGGPSPKSLVADNDLAVGRAVDAVSHSQFWDDTAFFILEDDAQNGADHVDAHRSIAFVVSKYSPHNQRGAPFIDSKFYTTVSVIRTMESLLDLPPMNNNDAFCSMIASLFTGPGDQPAFNADYSNRDNGLIYTANAKNAVGARESSKMDFTRPDRAPTEVLNVILWKDAMGDKTVPSLLKLHSKRSARDDDDE